MMDASIEKYDEEILTMLLNVNKLEHCFYVVQGSF